MDHANARRHGSIATQDHYHGTRRGSSIIQDHPQDSQSGDRRPVPVAPSLESLRAPSTIRIRRLPSSIGPQDLRPASGTGDDAVTPTADPEIEGRRRSFSAPQRYTGEVPLPGAPTLARQRTIDQGHMPAIREGNAFSSAARTQGTGSQAASAQTSRPVTPSLTVPGDDTISSNPSADAQKLRRLARYRSFTSTSRAQASAASYSDKEYDSDVIDLLDLVDPEVRTLGTLTNLQNSLFVPDLGSLINRRPTYDLTRHDSRPGSESGERVGRARAGTRASRIGPPHNLPPIPQGQGLPDGPQIELQESHESRGRRVSISSELSDSHYAVLPHGVSLEGWSEDEVAELNDHVRHLLHSKREGFKRGMRGFRKYISRPLGLFVFVYATLVTLFGAAWVFCLIGWIYVGSRQDYFINVIDNVLVALFALMGDGLAPFRAVDTYHMCFIAHYHHLTWRLRQERKMPNLVDENDLPGNRVSAAELEDAIDKEETAEFSVLTPKQQQRLQYHQAKFNKSHTFYKPHETSTHHAFPLRLLVAVVVLLDCHSLFQIALGTCTWSINYLVRPEALTATILSCSITCNIMAGVVISIGDHKTRKKDVLERMFRQTLTEEALKRMAKTHVRGELNLAVDPDRLVSEVIKDVHQEVTGKSGSKSTHEPDVDGATPAIGSDKLPSSAS